MFREVFLSKSYLSRKASAKHSKSDNKLVGGGYLGHCLWCRAQSPFNVRLGSLRCCRGMRGGLPGLVYGPGVGGHVMAIIWSEMPRYKQPGVMLLFLSAAWPRVSLICECVLCCAGLRDQAVMLRALHSLCSPPRSILSHSVPCVCCLAALFMQIATLGPDVVFVRGAG